jgi:hypothetical protein
LTGPGSTLGSMLGSLGLGGSRDEGGSEENK